MPVPITPVSLGDTVRLKKPHPCGANEWEVVRVGMDIGLRCTGCDRKIMLVRSEFDRRFRGFVLHAGSPAGGAPTAQSAAEPEGAGDRGADASSGSAEPGA